MKFQAKSLSLPLTAVMLAGLLFSGCVSSPTPGVTSPGSTAQTTGLPTISSTSPVTTQTIPPTPVPPTTVPPTTVPPTTAPPATVPPTTEPATQPTEPSNPILTASHAYIYRCRDDSFLFMKGTMEDRIYPASITKLFTAYVALQYLEPSQHITVGTAIYTVPPDSSLAFISVGEVYTVEQLIHGMLLPSGGDAARVIAAETGRLLAGKRDISDTEAINRCIDEMNRLAAALGMNGTHFVTPDGFHDPNHYTTMADLLTLTELSLNDPLIRKVVATAQYTVTLGGRSFTWRNTNMLLHENSQHPEFYRATAIGLKTGFTGAAGRCLLAAFIIDDEIIYAGVFGCPDPNWGFIAQFENICYLYDTYIAP